MHFLSYIDVYNIVVGTTVDLHIMVYADIYADI